MIYIASPQSEAPRARAFARRLREAGIEVVSTWHDRIEDGKTDAELSSAAKIAVASLNWAELRRASVCVALPCEGFGRETYCEIGAFVMLGRSVYYSAEKGGLPLSASLPVCMILPNDEALFRALVYACP